MMNLLNILKECLINNIREAFTEIYYFKDGIILINPLSLIKIKCL